MTPARRIRRHLPFAAVLVIGLVLRLAIAYVILPGEGLGSDLRLFSGWALLLADVGPGQFYEVVGFADYTPGYLWVLWLVGLIGEWLSSITGLAPGVVVASIIKLPAIFADMGVAVLLYRALSRWNGRRRGLAGAALFLFVPVTWYESALWGQVDSVGLLALLAAVVFVVERRSEAAVAAAVAAALIKPQYGIGVFLVAVVLTRRHLLAPRAEGDGAMRLVGSALVGALVAAVIALPFDLDALVRAPASAIPVIGDVAGLMALVGSAVGFYNVLTANAFNAWALVGPTPLSEAMSGEYRWTYDSLPVLGSVPAVTVGTGLLIAALLLTGYLLLRRDDRTSILLAATVLALAFFVLPTRVHERYLFPVFGFAALLAASSGGWRTWYLALGAVNFANLHAVLTLPYEGYGTPRVQALPLGAVLREEAFVIAIALGHTLLFGWAVVQLIASLRRPMTTEPRQSPVPWRLRSPAAVRTALSRFSRLPSRSLTHRLRGRLAAPSSLPDVSASLHREPGGRLDRLDLLVILLLVLSSLGLRGARLDQPYGMYFDEDYHARTATEFLQGWRYGIPHEIYEWTHPHLAKYAIAGSLALFGNNRVTDEGELGGRVVDLAYEPSFSDPGDPRRLSGDRLFVASGEGVRWFDMSGQRSGAPIAIPGASVLAVDEQTHQLYVGTSDGRIRSLPTPRLEADAGAPRLRDVAVMDLPVDGLWPVAGQLVVRSGESLQTVEPSSGAVVATISLAGLTDGVPLSGRNGPLFAATLEGGVQLLDARSLQPLSLLPLGAPPTGLDLVDGSDFMMRNRDLLPQPTVYVATTAARVETFPLVDGVRLEPGPTFPVPGPVSDVRWNPATNLVHLLGRDGEGRPTVYVVEPHANAVFADATLPAESVELELDVQPAHPTLDRQRALAVTAAGEVAFIAVGGNSFAWRLPGVVAGSLMVGAAYLLARLLFRRRSIGLLLGVLMLLDGLLFAHSRIAMNDAYVGFFIVAAYALLAFLVHRRHKGRAAWIAVLGGFPLVGVLLGLALASKWVGAFAVGGALLIVLFQSVIGRLMALIGMVLVSGFLGYLALAGDPPNLTFFVILVLLTMLMAAIISVRPLAPSEQGWLRPGWAAGAPFAWCLLSLVAVPIAVYVLSYLPWLGTAGDPQLLSGWPPGNRGQTFSELHVAMYEYHNDLRAPHGASSPWWAWPLDLKPIWAYLEFFASTTAATIVTSGNMAFFWLSIPAAAFAAWQAWRRESSALGVVIIALLAQWLPWARIDRVTYQYHYYPVLPFAFLLLAYFLAELWNGPSPRTWMLARTAAFGALLLPGLLWVLAAPLCGLAFDIGEGRCAGPGTDGLVTGLGYLLVAVPAGWWLVLRARDPRRFVLGVLAVGALVFLAIYPALAAIPLPEPLVYVYQGLLPTWDIYFQFASNRAPPPEIPLVAAGLLAVVAGMAAAALAAVSWARRRRAGPATPAAERRAPAL